MDTNEREGAWGERADGTAVALAPSSTVDLTALFWEAGLRGRPSLPMAVMLEGLVDGCSMGGGVFSLGSAAFALTRVAVGQLDAYVDAGRRVLDTFPELEPELRRAPGPLQDVRFVVVESAPAAPAAYGGLDMVVLTHWRVSSVARVDGGMPRHATLTAMTRPPSSSRRPPCAGGRPG